MKFDKMCGSWIWICGFLLDVIDIYLLFDLCSFGVGFFFIIQFYYLDNVDMFMEWNSEFIFKG